MAVGKFIPGCCSCCTITLTAPPPGSVCETNTGGHSSSFSGVGGCGNPITISATSSNTSVIPDPTVIYTSPNTFGTLNWTSSSATGVATISVTNTAGGQSLTKTYTITVAALSVGPPTLVVSSPTLTFAKNSSTTYNITISGAGFGLNPGGAATSYVVSLTSQVPGIMPNPTGGFSSPTTGGTGVVGPPIPNATGSSFIIVKILTNFAGPPVFPCTSNVFSIAIPFTVT